MASQLDLNKPADLKNSKRSKSFIPTKDRRKISYQQDTQPSQDQVRTDQMTPSKLSTNTLSRERRKASNPEDIIIMKNVVKDEATSPNSTLGQKQLPSIAKISDQNIFRGRAHEKSMSVNISINQSKKIHRVSMLNLLQEKQDSINCEKDLVLPNCPQTVQNSINSLSLKSLDFSCLNTQEGSKTERPGLRTLTCRTGSQAIFVKQRPVQMLEVTRKAQELSVKFHGD